MNAIRIAGIVLGSIALVLIGVLAVGFLLPSRWSVERSTWIDAPPEAVYAHLESARAWGRWTPSPESDVEHYGPEVGVGSGRRWDDPGYGRGDFRIVRHEPTGRIDYEVDVEGGSIRIEGSLTLEAVDGGTRVQWREDGDFGWNPLLGYLAGRMDDLQGAQLDASLGALRALVEEGAATAAAAEGSPAAR